MLTLKAMAVWIGILLLAVLNGTLREAWLIPAFGSTVAFVASGVLLALLILASAWSAIPWLGVRTARSCLYVGALWFCATLAFEFGFGRFVQHRSWSELMAAYTFEGGNIWPLDLAVVLFAPLVVARWRFRRVNSAPAGD
jgi:hypothetical protein